MNQPREKSIFIVNTAAYERVLFALSLAVAEATLNKEVNVLFGHGAAVRLKKGLTDRMGDETQGWIKDQVEVKNRDENFSKVSDLLDYLCQMDCRLFVCRTSMELHGLKKEDLIDGVSQTNLVEFLNEQARNATKVIYV
ncbi:MAG: DsrE family protein [Chloroflexi bacterium]|nr:DsrE family protein [Chloroflexota bacterium]